MNRSLLCDLCIAILAQILRTAVAHENEDLLAPSRQDAKFGIPFFTFAPLRLCVFARDIPTFGCGSAALGSLWLYPNRTLTRGRKTPAGCARRSSYAVRPKYHRTLSKSSARPIPWKSRRDRSQCRSSTYFHPCSS